MTDRLSLGSDAVADAEEFIHTMIVWGEHHYDRTRQWTMQQMRTEIPEFEQVLADVRLGSPIKYFENLLGASWYTASSSHNVPGVGVRNPTSGEEVVLDGPGIIELSSYAAAFETAVAAWNRAVERESHAELLSAFRDGMAAIEGFVARQAANWNAAHPDDQLDESKRRVGFIQKLEEWVPKMAGAGLDQTKIFWSHLIEVKNYRDKVAVHPKHSVLGVSLVELARLANLFTSGIAIPLFNLHQFVSPGRSVTYHSCCLCVGGQSS
jgi:hypothetical protein